MGFIATLLSGLGQWALKIFLGGLFNKVLSQIQDDAQHKVDAANAQVASQKEASAVEVAVVQAQVDAKAKVDGAVKTPDDPFGDRDWNTK